MKAKKGIFAAIALALAAVTLASCVPVADLVTEPTTAPMVGPSFPSVNDTTEIESFVVRTDNYYFDSGEYYYFFTELVNEKVSLGELQKGQELSSAHPSGVSWGQYLRESTLEHLTELLLVCEIALAENGYYANEAQTYYNEQVKAPLSEQARLDPTLGSFENLIYKSFDGLVSTSAYSNAIQKEYIYERYLEKRALAVESALSDAEVEEFVSSIGGEKDTSLTKSLAIVEIEAGSEALNAAAAEELLAALEAGERSDAALEALAEAQRFEFSRLDDVALGDTTLDAWLFAEERQIGDATTVKLEGDMPVSLVVLYCADGKPTYLVRGREELTAKRLNDWVDGLANVYTVTVDREKLASLTD